MEIEARGAIQEAGGRAQHIQTSTLRASLSNPTSPTITFSPTAPLPKSPSISSSPRPQSGLERKSSLSSRSAAASPVPRNSPRLSAPTTPRHRAGRASQRGAITSPIHKAASSRLQQSPLAQSRPASDVTSPPKRARMDPPVVVQGSVKLLPPLFQYCETQDLVHLIADMLGELVLLNDQIPLNTGVLTRFHSRAPPSISIPDYLSRLTLHSSLQPSTLLSMVYYIDILSTLYPTFTISSLTVHRFLITAATVASKGLCDSFLTNSFYAKVGGVSLMELNLLELEFLTRTGWRIVPRGEVLMEYYKSLVGRMPTRFRIDPTVAVGPTLGIVMAGESLEPERGGGLDGIIVGGILMESGGSQSDGAGDENSSRSSDAFSETNISVNGGPVPETVASPTGTAPSNAATTGTASEQSPSAGDENN